MSYGVDRHYWPFDLTAADNAIVISEDGGARSDTISVSAGTYWNHADPALTDRPGLLKALVDAVNASSVLSGTYFVASFTPNGSSLSSSGVGFGSSGTVSSFTFEFANPATTIDPRLLGFEVSPGNQASGLNDAIIGAHSIRGKWQSYGLADNASSDKTGDTRADTMQSREDAVLAYTNEKLERDWRHYRYDYVPAMHVTPTTARPGYTTAYWESAGLPSGDYNNGFKSLWTAAKRNAEIIVVHDEGDEDLLVATHDYEIYKLDPAKRSKFRDVADTQNMNGEYYKIEYDAVIVDGSYDY